MSLKNSMRAIATLVGIVALMMMAPGVSHASAVAHRSNSRDQSPGIVLAENEPAAASADNDSDTDSKESDDDTTAEDQDDANDQTEQQSAGNQQVNPQFQNGDNEAGDAGEAPQPMNVSPQQMNPYQ